MSLVQVWQILWVRRWHLLLCLVVCVGAAVVLASRLPPTYEARARVLLEVVKPDMVTGQLLNEHDVASYIRTQQLLVMGDRVAGKVVDKLGWATNPAIVDAWTASTGGAGDVRSWAAQRIQGATAAYPLENSGTLEILYQAPDPEAAAAIVRLIREAFVETTLEMATEGARSRATRFDALAVKSRTDLAAAESKLRDVLAASGTALDAAGEDLDRRAFEASQDFVVPRQQRAMQDAQASARAAGQSTLTAELRKALAAVDDALQLEGSQLGPSNPRLVSLVERRAALLRQLAAADAATRARLGGINGLARSGVSRPEAEFNAERARLLAKQPTSLQILQAQRLVALRRADLGRIEDTAARLHLLADRSESGLVVMGDAIASSDPVAPNVPLAAAIAALFGSMLAVVAALLDGLVGREVLGARDLEFASGVPVLGIVPAGPRQGWFARRGWLMRWRAGRATRRGALAAG